MMLEKIKNIISKTDRLLYKKFGSDKSTKSLENIKEAQIIFSCLNEVGKENTVRFVGGCVRKAICGENIDDIDSIKFAHFGIVTTASSYKIISNRINKIYEYLNKSYLEAEMIKLEKFDLS